MRCLSPAYIMAKTNPNLESLISELRKLGREAPLWRRIAEDLDKSTRRRRIVNLSRLDKYTSENDTVVVPGKVLGAGPLNHKLTIAAWGFSEGALKKISEANAKALSIQDLMKEPVKGKRIRIIG